MKERRNLVLIVIMIIIMIIVIANVIMIILINQLNNGYNELDKRLTALELDYKIYELNLQNLEDNKEVQFGR